MDVASGPKVSTPFDSKPSAEVRGQDFFQQFSRFFLAVPGKVGFDGSGKDDAADGVNPSMWEIEVLALVSFFVFVIHTTLVRNHTHPGLHLLPEATIVQHGSPCHFDDIIRQVGRDLSLVLSRNVFFTLLPWV